MFILLGFYEYFKYFRFFTNTTFQFPAKSCFLPAGRCSFYSAFTSTLHTSFYSTFTSTLAFTSTLNTFVFYEYDILSFFTIPVSFEYDILSFFYNSGFFFYENSGFFFLRNEYDFSSFRQSLVFCLRDAAQGQVPVPGSGITGVSEPSESLSMLRCS